MAESTNLMEEMVDRGMTNLTDELASWVLRINMMCAEKDAEIARLTEIVDQEHPKLIAEIARLKAVIEQNAGLYQAEFEKQAAEIERLNDDRADMSMMIERLIRAGTEEK